MGSYNPGPSTYKGDHNQLKSRILAVKIPDPKEKSSWRPVKSKLPDCASYEVAKAKTYVGKSQFIHKFAHPKEDGVKFVNETLTTKAT